MQMLIPTASIAKCSESRVDSAARTKSVVKPRPPFHCHYQCHCHSPTSPPLQAQRLFNWFSWLQLLILLIDASNEATSDGSVGSDSGSGSGSQCRPSVSQAFYAAHSPLDSPRLPQLLVGHISNDANNGSDKGPTGLNWSKQTHRAQASERERKRQKESVWERHSVQGRQI